MKNKKYNITLDLLKVLSTILIIGSHCLPLFANKTLNYYYGQYLFRFCVPLFFLSSGYYFTKMNNKQKKSYIKRICIIYVISTIIYVPLIIKKSASIRRIIYRILFGYYHLWYLSALLLGLLIYYFIDKINSNKKYYLIIPLLTISILFSEYYKLFDSDFLVKICHYLKYIGTARNSLFFALPLLMIGGLIQKNHEALCKIKTKRYVICLIISAIVSFLESYFIYKKLGYNIHLDITLFNMIFPIALFILSFKVNINIKNFNSQMIRKISDYVYIIHIYIIYIFYSILNISYMRHIKGFICVTIISFLSSAIIYYIIDYKKIFKKH